MAEQFRLAYAGFAARRYTQSGDSHTAIASLHVQRDGVVKPLFPHETKLYDTSAGGLGTQYDRSENEQGEEHG